MRRSILVAAGLLLLVQSQATPYLAQSGEITRQERLRGSVTPERAWWDLLHYDLSVQFLPETRSLKGSNAIAFKTLAAGDRMQIDLQPPLEITSVTHGGEKLAYEREGNVYWITFAKPLPAGVEDRIDVSYEGVPVVAKRPPWDGGITWERDDLGNPFITTTCQGIGASIWWPCKDHGYDEPDRGMRIAITVPEALVAVSNGRLKRTEHDAAAKTKTYHWEVLNPINNYGVNANIGNYVHWSETYAGEGGTLDIDYWVLAHQKDEAMRQFKEARRTLEALEHWFGKYPFYEDSYKLVTVPYLGMEHQSSVTYGNAFRNGYMTRDLSGTGVGLKFDFIIVHESAHEWFGNNISMKDAADMWIHEGFANYSESLFVEYWFGKEAAETYVVGTRRGIQNDRPIIGTYESNREGSGDMYPKGGNMLHTIRQLVGDDEKWRAILRGLNAELWHQTVTTEQVERYIAEKAGLDLSKVFDQYLRTKDVPLLRYKIDGRALTYRYDHVVDGFAMPLRATVNGKVVTLTPTATTQTFTSPEVIATFAVDRNYYVETAKDE
jgi:aminopeptidase N